jgi:hypothetical protein
MKRRSDMSRFFKSGTGLMLLMLATSCACPGHLGTKTVALEKLTKDPKIGLDYMGSDTRCHYFFRRNCYSLFALGEGSVTDRFRVKKEGVIARQEFGLTKDRTAWRHYYIASTVERFEGDFVITNDGAIPSKSVEPSGPANGSQPIRLGTNLTSSVTGSRP